MQNPFKKALEVRDNANKNTGDVNQASCRQNTAAEYSCVFNGRPQTYDVFVGHIPQEWSEEKLWEICSPYGEIKSIQLKDTLDFKYNTRIGFVRFAREDDAKKAVEFLSRNSVGNVFLQVNMAQRSKNKDRQTNPEPSQGRKPYSDFRKNNPNIPDVQRGNERGQYWSPGKQDNRQGKGWQQRRGVETEYGGGYSGNTSNIATSKQQNTWNSGRSHVKTGQAHHDGGLYGGQQQRDWKYNPNAQKIVVLREEVVLVTEVESSVSFWGQVGITSVAQSLAESSEELQVCCPTSQKVGTTIQQNKVYGGLYPFDNLWYRCTVLEFLQQGMVKVKYVDYGNLETIKQDGLVELPSTLRDAAPFAHHFQLADCTVCSDPASAQMTNPLAYEQLKNLINGKLVSVKVVSEGPHGACEVLVEYPDDPSKTINDVMIAGGCVQRIKRSDGGVIKRSVAEKPLNEENRGNGESKTKKNLVYENESLRKTIKFQCETICNLNKLFDAVREQNNELNQELEQAFNRKVKLILSSVEDLNQTRDHCVFDDKRSKVINDGISLITDVANRLTLEHIHTFSKVCFSSDALRLSQDSIKNCDDKEKLKELIVKRNGERKELHLNANIFLEEMSSLAIDQREENLKMILKELYVPNQNVQGDKPSLEQAIASYNEWKVKQHKQSKSVCVTTDSASSRLADEFAKLQKLLDPTVDFGLHDCGTVDLHSTSLEFTGAVANEIQQTQAGEDRNGMAIISTLIGALRNEIQHEISDIIQLRNSTEGYTQLQGNLERWLDHEPDVSKILDIRKNLKSVKSKFRHKQADRKDFEEGDDVNHDDLKKIEEELTELRSQLHALLNEERLALEELAQLAEEHFPELPLLNVELNLKKFMATNGLLKQGWELMYYSHSEMAKMSLSSANYVAFQTSFNGGPCVLKEFNLEDITDVDLFESRAVAYYSMAKHSNLAELQALFYDKTNRKAFIQLPYFETNLKSWLASSPSDKSKRGVIRDVVECLCCLHQSGITHGDVVMENIFVDASTRGILGEYCFVNDTQKRVSSTAEMLLKNTVPITCDTSPVFDMYCLGEIVCQVFLGEIPMVQDLTSLQKLSQDKDLTSMLVFLLALDGGLRPTAGQVLGHPFFNDTSSSLKDETTEDHAKRNEQEEKPSETREEKEEEQMNGQEGLIKEQEGQMSGQIEEGQINEQEKEGHMNGQTEGQMNGQTEGQLNGQLNGQTEGQMNGQTEGQLNGQTEGKVNGREEEKMNEQKEEEMIGKEEESNEVRNSENEEEMKDEGEKVKPVMEEKQPTLDEFTTPDEKPAPGRAENDEKPTVIVDDKELDDKREDEEQCNIEGLSDNGGQIVDQAKIPDNIIISEQSSTSPEGEKTIET